MTTSQSTIDTVFSGVPYMALHADQAEQDVKALAFSSREVEPGTLFFCVPGTRVDGHDFAADAVKRGAIGLVVEQELPIEAPQYLVKDAREALALCSANFYDNPSEKLAVVGVTGTNGKTTVTFLTEHLVQFAGKKAGLIGTVECHVGDEVIPSEHTTPESRDFQELLARMVDDDTDVCACEVSSHALDLGRVKGTQFAIAAFSNLTQDHLDYHKTMKSYFETKVTLFTEYAPKACVICTDSNAGIELAERCIESGRNVIRVGSSADCDVRLLDAHFEPTCTVMDLDVSGERLSVRLPLVGRFNVENALIVFGIGKALGYSMETVVGALESAPQVPGRLERVVAPNGDMPPFGVLVDYAHTPDSVGKAISALRAVTKGKIICVLGCGGDRDHGKRPKMGAAALNADYVIVTSDNPRTENPDSIIEQMLRGMDGGEGRFEVLNDRTEAIHRAIELAEPGDVVLIAGKGHEDYQIVGTTKYHFDDREVAAQALEEMGR